MTSEKRRVGARVRSLAAGLVALVAASGSVQADAQIAPSFGFYIDEPFVQTAYYTVPNRSNVQEFNSLALGTAATPATWSGISVTNGVVGNWSVVAGDQWGGATTDLPAKFGDPQLVEGVATRSRYGLIPATQSLTIDLATPATCLGFWWSGGDDANAVEFFTTDADGVRVSVAKIVTSDLTERLKNSDNSVTGLTVTALDGSTYNAIDFYGHPVSTGSKNTPSARQWGPPGTVVNTNLYAYLYVHAIAQGGVTFDRLVMSQGASGNFEFDNVTLATGCAVKQSLVLVADVLDATFAQSFAAAQTSSSAASPPSVSCVPSPLVAGASVTCIVTGGDPGIDILWRAAYNLPFAGEGVALDAFGVGSFSFVVPRAAAGQEVTVELVEWAAPVSLGVVGGPVPSSVPSGGGPAVPAGLLLFGIAAAAFGLRRLAVGTVG